MQIIVQKFGGTSVSTAENRTLAVGKIREAIEKGYSPVVVVSAMGRKGQPYATDTLLSVAAEASTKLSNRDKDLLMGCGEIISAVVFTGTLIEAGIPASAFTGAEAGILTDDKYGSAECLHVSPERLQLALSRGIVPVVTGFQGAAGNGDLTTLGRGGSDTSAALLGTALHADLIEIYTDVDGIMTADPRYIEEARVIDELNYSEVFQMADQGANVIHPKAVEAAMRGGVPLVVRNTFSAHPGTRISNAVSDSESESIMTSIARQAGRAQLMVDLPDDDMAEQLLGDLADHEISIDLINIFPGRVVCTVAEADSAKAEERVRAMGLEPNLRGGCVKVSCIGHKMRGVPGVMARVARALRHAGISILQTADSNMTISCLVDASQAVQAIQALHNEFDMG